MSDLISRSALLEAGSARKINEAVEGWNELPSNAKAACIRLARENKKLVMAAPAVDAVEVVRCKDCRAYSKNPWSESGEMVCKCWVDWLPTEPDDFCSNGERRAEDATD